MSIMPVDPPSSPSRGDVGRGIGLFFLYSISAGLLAKLLGVLLQRMMPLSAKSMLALVSIVSNLLWLGLIIWTVVMAKRQGRPGIIKGLLMGFLIGLALTVLLVAAFFGVMFALCGGLGRR